MLLSEFIKEGTDALCGEYPRTEASSIISLLCCGRLGVQKYTHIIDPGYVVPDAGLPGIIDDLHRLKDGEPIQYVLGRAEFCGRSFKVTPSVLIPRPETEQLVSMALEHVSEGSRVMDLCTGSGCIAWSIVLGGVPCQVTGVDISGEALEVAESQFENPSVSWVKADILNEPQGFEPGGYDVLVSNPPYIMEMEKARMQRNVLEHEPRLALFVPDSDPLVFYRAVAAWASCLLRPGGWGCVEINRELPEETGRVFSDAGFAGVLQHRDFYGEPRFIEFTKEASQ